MAGAAALAVLAAIFGNIVGYWPLLLAGWFVLGIAYSMSSRHPAPSATPQMATTGLPFSLPSLLSVMAAG